MSADIKFSTSQLSKIIQPGGFLGAVLGIFVGPLMEVAVPFAKNVLVPLATSASVIDGAIQRKKCGRGVIRAGKRITLVTSNEDIDDIIRIVKSLENSGVLIDGLSETVNMKYKNKRVDFLVCF